MLNEITLKFGASASSKNLQFQTQTINVFVGPNNSGKSTLLKEIEEFLNRGASMQPQHFSMVEGVKVDLPSDPDELLSMLRPYIESEHEYAGRQDRGLSLRKYNLVDERGAVSNVTLPKSFVTDPSVYGVGRLKWTVQP